MDDAAKLFDRVREIYSQEYVAQELSRDIRTILRWEKGKSPIPKMAEVALRQLLKGESISKAAKTQVGYRRSHTNFDFIDLFAGIGGTRLGFERAGGRCVFTSEWDKYACQTYRANHRDDHEINGDITKVDVSNIPSHDVLVGGFPCQPFSLAGVSKKNSMGRAHGFLCETQGTLFFDIARILESHRPRAFLLENVKNLRSHDKGKTIEVIKRTLIEELGYHVYDQVIDAKCLVPQHRERIYIVGFREDVDFSFNGLGFPPIESGPCLETILHSSLEEADNHYTESYRGKTRVNPKYTLSDKLWNYLTAYAKKHRDAGNGFGCSVVKPSDVSRTLSARYHKDGSEILIHQVAGNPRRLTPRECARLMGFPDSFDIPVSDTQAYRQFGNSVVVPVIERLARGIVACLEGTPMLPEFDENQLLIPGMVSEPEIAFATA